MSLIKCPECRQQISSSAENCPNCGYNIQQHYKKIEQQIQLQKIINSIQEPESPHINLLLLFISISFIVCGIIIGVRTLKIGTEGTIILSVSMFIFGIIGLILTRKEYIERLSQYQWNIDHLDKYKLQTAISIMAEQYEHFIPKCPYCNSKNIYKISNASRFLSTALFGLGSRKIGKQWHCNNCGSDF